jgi:hypothetical protein
LPLPSAEELDSEGERLLALASRDSPRDLPAATVRDRGFAVDALVKRIDVGAHDLVILRRSLISLLLPHRTLSRVIEIGR